MLCKIKRYAINVANTHFIFTLLCDYYLFIKIFFQTFYFVITFYITERLKTNSTIFFGQEKTSDLLSYDQNRSSFDILLTYYERFY